MRKLHMLLLILGFSVCSIIGVAEENEIRIEDDSIYNLVLYLNGIRT